MTEARDIIRIVAQEAGVKADAFLADRTWRGARRRQIAMLLLRERGLSFHQIKRLLKYGDHTTIVQGCRAMQERLARPMVFPEYCTLYGKATARLHDKD